MRFIFVNWAHDTHGSAQDLHNYSRVARTMGHEVAIYGSAQSASPFDYSMEIRPDDAIVFVFEFTTNLQQSERLSFVRMLSRVPRHRRIVIDCDGKYNDAVNVVGDLNHPDDASSRRWIEVCDSLSDKVYQPTYHPLRPNVRPFFFHAYNPAWEAPLECGAKPFGMVYVGNNWFRWRALRKVLEAIEPIRHEVGRIALVGHGWNGDASWGGPSYSADAYYSDPRYLRTLGVEVLPPVRFDRVVARMGEGVCAPVIYRPLFNHLRLVTCRTFETPAANTIPLFTQEESFVTEIYGRQAAELILPDHEPSEKVQDVLARPDHYAEIVGGMRRHLAQTYSYDARLKELADLVRN
jgi:hypothetical protein